MEDDGVAIGVNGDPGQLSQSLGCLWCGPGGVGRQVRGGQGLGLPEAWGQGQVDVRLGQAQLQMEKSMQTCVVSLCRNMR